VKVDKEASKSLRLLEKISSDGETSLIGLSFIRHIFFSIFFFIDCSLKFIFPPFFIYFFVTPSAAAKNN
jgi:hypothetical protein